eukprot:2002247-Prymnesium_polylepis.2
MGRRGVRQGRPSGRRAAEVGSNLQPSRAHTTPEGVADAHPEARLLAPRPPPRNMLAPPRTPRSTSVGTAPPAPKRACADRPVSRGCHVR